MSLTDAEVLAKVQAGNTGIVQALDNAATKTDGMRTYTTTGATTLDLTTTTYNAYTKFIVANSADSTDPVVVTTADIAQGGVDAEGIQYTYYTSSTTHSVTVGYYRIFLRVMFDPSTWEASDEIAL